ncbi:MAG: 4-(cytidine 5'-diphospho)-2-C-methyl-D-erythritol kinase [Nocardiopsaceae bacterium]|nr:4-(cytidine 5'-diphospho)-2-C-methyl-D-erythritol kinase [Nocardiopsaceae bacterium]
MTAVTAVTVRVPAKVNLQLAVGPVREDGYHDLVNVFHAVALFDEVTVTAPPARAGRRAIRLTIDGNSGVDTAAVPLDDSNLAAKAAHLVARETGATSPIDIHLRKTIPVAGGMAGGSADAAATLVACNTFWEAGLSQNDLHTLAAELGSDVAFPLLGATAVGTGRGEQLTPIPSPGRYHWVFALSDTGLSTADVFAEYDRLRPQAPQPQSDPDLMAALAAGDAPRLGAALGNDLQRAALSLRPDLGATLDAGRTAGALGAIVSGSGPTCAFLAASEAKATAIATALEKTPHCARTIRTHGDVPGATVIERTPAS